jgi:hypothetical protein
VSVLHRKRSEYYADGIQNGKWYTFTTTNFVLTKEYSTTSENSILAIYVKSDLLQVTLDPNINIRTLQHRKKGKIRPIKENSKLNRNITVQKCIECLNCQPMNYTHEDKLWVCLINGCKSKKFTGASALLKHIISIHPLLWNNDYDFNKIPNYPWFKLPYDFRIKMGLKNKFAECMHCILGDAYLQIHINELHKHWSNCGHRNKYANQASNFSKFFLRHLANIPTFGL